MCVLFVNNWIEATFWTQFVKLEHRVPVIILNSFKTRNRLTHRRLMLLFPIYFNFWISKQTCAIWTARLNYCIIIYICSRKYMGKFVFSLLFMVFYIFNFHFVSNNKSIHPSALVKHFFSNWTWTFWILNKRLNLLYEHNLLGAHNV